MPGELHLASYRRCIWDEGGMLVVIGDFSPVLRSRETYQRKHEIEPATGPGAAALDRLLAAAGLAALSLADRESWGWSVSLPDAAFGLFCGVEPEGMICGRLRPAERDRAAAVLQRQKAGGPLVQSHFTPVTADPVDAVAMYFETVDQIATRLAVDESWSSALVQVLPGGRFELVADRSDDCLLALVDELDDGGRLEQLDEVLLFYECRCDDRMILDMIASLPDEQRDEVWGDERELEVECPRCSRQYTIRRRPVRPEQ